MKILFFMQELGVSLRLFEAPVRLLAQRGHRIHVVAEFSRSGQTELAERLAREHPSFSFELLPPELDARRRRRGWSVVAWFLRSSLEYLRFLQPAHEAMPYTPALRAKAQRRAPRSMVRICHLPIVRSRLGVRLLGACLGALEQAIPSRSEVERFISERQPDLVLVTPLVTLGSSQADYLRSAKALGIGTCLCVGSWDHLSTKALIRDLPDLVTVWNETQKAEAVRMHRVPPERVVVTGAQPFDQWFEWRPRPREEFCRMVGISPERPFLLYAVSALFAASIRESDFVRTWIRQIRSSSSAALREAGILIRPHPKRGREWRNVDLSEFDNVAVWPRGGTNPIDAQSKADYFDSMYHCAALIGLNTSTMIEAGIVGRPVHTILVPEFADSQDSTLHFQYLLDRNGGLVHVAGSLDEHLVQLSQVLDGLHPDDGRSRQFVESFVRPHGLDVAAAPLLAEAIERLGATPRPSPSVTPFRRRVVRRLLWQFAVKGSGAAAVAGATAASGQSDIVA